MYKLNSYLLNSYRRLWRFSFRFGKANFSLQKSCKYNVSRETSHLQLSLSQIIIYRILSLNSFSIISFNACSNYFAPDSIYEITRIQIDACGDLAPDSVCEANIFLFESVRSLRSASVGSYVVPRTTRPAERLSQSEIVLSLRQVCYYSSPIEVRVFSD